MRTEKQILNNLNEILAVKEETLENYTIYDMLKKGTEDKFKNEKLNKIIQLIDEIIENKLYKKVAEEKELISSNTQLLNYLEHTLIKKDIEYFKVLFLDVQNRLIKEETLFEGTLDRSTVYIREFVKKVLNNNAKSIIMVHNHPGGSLKPSQADIALTRKVRDTLENIETRLLDHLIISEKGYFSFLESGIL